MWVVLCGIAYYTVLMMVLVDIWYSPLSRDVALFYRTVTY